ncbi:Sir2 family NAD-dependent protein deacetylase [Acuticoccus sp. I52.16.1]|uniref:SIR2 family NAD-dependent protein deacylase n=1 Tax=Acuticoccus sp. I52.16.1 TaxID=2928472 RepID=UPI001FD41DE8|nr:Sir2 family NAD-dependent protein deacetylase [Acuticoccus sp. I52.16.1]UOM34854.1 Sir2 family NAD-dependent protein deacetylase [Acuticoccus sp. I52.16.1]
MVHAIFDNAEKARNALAEAFAQATRAVVFTGAGISTESGIPDFRSAGGIWSRMEPILYDTFVTSEEARLEDWRRRFDMAERFAAARPNGAHEAIAHLATAGPVSLVVTQNIDGLHSRAGVPPEKLVELHGAGDHATCLECGTRHEISFAQDQIAKTGMSPRCTVCGGLLKAAIISFGQAMPEDDLERAMKESVMADLFVAAGTSLVVYPAAALPQMAKEAGARLIICSRDPTDQDQEADLLVRTPLAETMGPLKQMKFA